MRIEKLPDGSYATTPIFIGSLAEAEAFEEKQKTCAHEWEEKDKRPSPEDAECVMTIEVCYLCRGTRNRITGPQENLDKMFLPKS